MKRRQTKALSRLKILKYAPRKEDPLRYNNKTISNMLNNKKALYTTPEMVTLNLYSKDAVLNFDSPGQSPLTIAAASIIGGTETSYDGVDW